jgi:hypothetical protein
MKIASIFLPVLAGLPIVLAGGEGRAEGPNWKGPLVVVQEPERAWTSGKAGWPLRIAKPEGARIAIVEPGKTPRVLTEGFASACDPCVSHDGRRILFAGKAKTDASWDIYEIGVDGKGLRKITEGLGDCFEPEYLARGSITAPDYKDKVRWIVFVSTAHGRMVEAGGAQATSLFVRSLEPVPGRGIVTWRTTYNLSSDFSPTVLADGRVLFSSWQNFPGRFEGSKGAVELFTTSWSGEDLNLFLPADPGTVRTMAREAPFSILFIESDGSTPDRSGRLARIWLRRPLKTYQVLSKVPGRFRDPQMLPDGRLLVAHAPEGKGFGLYAFDFSKGGPGEVIFDDPERCDVDAAPVAARPEPTGRITMVNEKAKAAALTCLNVYDSDLPDVRALPRGAVAKVRFIEGLPAGSTGRAEPGARVLGEAPVEKDGSFLVRIVPETPFTLQLLDGEGRVLAGMRSWLGLQKGDERLCIGCHEDKELAPENRVTEALLKGKPWPILAPAEKRRLTDFSWTKALNLNLDLTNGTDRR